MDDVPARDIGGRKRAGSQDSATFLAVTTPRPEAAAMILGRTFFLVATWTNGPTKKLRPFLAMPFWDSAQKAGRK